MASIRTRVTAAYALALGGTMLAFSAGLWTSRRSAVLLELQRSVSMLADIGHLVLTQAGMQNNPVVVTNDSLRGPELQPLVRARLDAVPGFLVVSDSLRPLYTSAAVRSLPPEDIGVLVAATMLLTPEQRVATVQLSFDKLLMVAHFRDGRRRPGAPRGGGRFRPRGRLLEQRAIRRLRAHRAAGAGAQRDDGLPHHGSRDAAGGRAHP